MNVISIPEAVSRIQRGEVVATPTEAVYGLSCDPTNELALQKLLDIKRRPIEKGLILLATNLSQVADYVEPLTDEQMAFCSAHWPGAVTILLPTKPGTSRYLRGGFDSLAVRLTAHPVMREFIEALGHPVVSTSANLAGGEMARSVDELDPALFPATAGVLDGALGNQKDPSKIFDLKSGERLR